MKKFPLQEIGPFDYLNDFPDKNDVLRYVLCSIAPETKDSEFTWKDFQTRNNSELVGIFGNFVHRTLVLCHKYFDGKVPEKTTSNSSYHKIDEQLKKHVNAMNVHLESFEFREAQIEALAIARLGNKFLADTEPWKIIKVDEERVKAILNIAVQLCANLSLAFEAFLPSTSKKLRSMLNLEDLEFDNLGNPQLVETGHQLNTPELLFHKIEDDVIESQIEKLRKSSKPNNTINKSLKSKAMIEFEDFTKLDLKIGTITAAEKMPKSKKLLRLTVDLGSEQRTILSGIAEHYSEEEVLNKKVQVLTNLAPRKMMGILSEGMILLAEDSNGKLTFVSPEKDVENGSIVS